MNEAVILVIDTNILLHYKPLAQIDWCGFFDAKTVTLMICMPVIDELDSKKSDQRLADRAKRAIKEIKEYNVANKELRPGVTLNIYQVKSDPNHDSQDEQIVSLVQRYKVDNPNSDVCVVSEDYGMGLRCSGAGILTRELDEEYRLENPGDEKDKKLKQALNELAALKNKVPKLSLRAVIEGQTPMTEDAFACVLTDDWIDLDVGVEMEKQRKLHPPSDKVRAEMNASQVYVRDIDRIFSHIKPEQWKTYDRDVNSYLVKYEGHIQGMNTWGRVTSRLVRFDLWFLNTGSTPATDIDVEMTFSDKIMWLVESESEEALALVKPRAPTAPERPKPVSSALTSFGHSYKGALSFPDGLYRSLPESPTFWQRGTPEVSIIMGPNESPRLHAKLDRLKHNQPVLLGAFLMVFGDWDVVSPFEVEYSISNAECSEKTFGKFVMKVTKDTDTSKKT